MLEELAKEDKYFRGIAFNICKDKSMADDLVQEMYLKISGISREIKDLKWYAVIVIRNLFYDQSKKPSNTDLSRVNLMHPEKYEPDDKEKKVLDRLTWLERELLEESCDKSLREIEKEYNINYAFTHRIIKNVRNGAKKT